MFFAELALMWVYAWGVSNERTTTMKTTNQTTTKSEAELVATHKRQIADIASLLDWFECEIQKRADEEATWSRVGSLSKVREDLIEALAFVSGTDVATIQESLEEVNG